MPSKQVILNADGTYSLPFWGGKFWTKKITGHVTHSDVNNTDHYSSSYQTLETTSYYGRSGYLIGRFTTPRTHTVRSTIKNSYFSLKDEQGNTHEIYVSKHINIPINEGDLVTVIKSDSIRRREATIKDPPIQMDVQVKYILNHTAKRSASTQGVTRLSYALDLIMTPILPMLLFAGFFITLFGFISNTILNIGLALLVSPFVILFLVRTYFSMTTKTKADRLIPYFSIVARSKDGKVSQAELNEAYASGKYYIYRSKNHYVAAALAFFTGAFGFHKFYLGYYKQGFIMLSVALIAFIVPSYYEGSHQAFVIILWADILVALIESILYLFKSQKKFAETYLIGKRPWF